MRSLLPCTPVPCTNCCLGCVVVAAKCSRRPSALSPPIVNSWVSCELRKTLEKDYLVTNVSEMWQFRITRSLYEARWFVCRINSFLKLKQEDNRANAWMTRVRNSIFGNTKKLKVLFSIEIISFEILVYVRLRSSA